MPTLTWVGKDKVANHHHDVPFRLLNKEYTFSTDEETSDAAHANRIIHGDNLDALKSLLPEFEGAASNMKCNTFLVRCAHAETDHLPTASA